MGALEERWCFVVVGLQAGDEEMEAKNGRDCVRRAVRKVRVSSGEVVGGREVVGRPDRRRRGVGEVCAGSEDIVLCLTILVMIGFSGGHAGACAVCDYADGSGDAWLGVVIDKLWG